MSSSGRRPRLPGGQSASGGAPAIDALAPRWRGQTDRVEVWYATVSDPEVGWGCWIHHEMTAPVDGDPFAHGWTAVFRPGTTPILERFGPSAVVAPVVAGASDRVRPSWASVDGATFDPPAMRGELARLGWSIQWEEAGADAQADGDAGAHRPLFTFPAWAWDREALPAAQVLPIPSAPFSGTVRVDGHEHRLSSRARGAVAHIYGHGSAERWGWLHAELGDGDVLELVSAVSRRPGLNRLPPLAFVQLRAGGRDWPRDPLVSAPLFRTRLGLPTWTVRGTAGRWRLRVTVTIPDDRSVRVGYVDPDGSTATCTNSESSDAEIVLEHRRSRWELERRWELRACAHAEIGTRP